MPVVQVACQFVECVGVVRLHPLKEAYGLAQIPQGRIHRVRGEVDALWLELARNYDTPAPRVLQILNYRVQPLRRLRVHSRCGRHATGFG